MGKNTLLTSTLLTVTLSACAGAPDRPDKYGLAEDIVDGGFAGDDQAEHLAAQTAADLRMSVHAVVDKMIGHAAGSGAEAAGLMKDNAVALAKAISDSELKDRTFISEYNNKRFELRCGKDSGRGATDCVLLVYQKGRTKPQEFVFNDWQPQMGQLNYANYCLLDDDRLIIDNREFNMPGELYFDYLLSILETPEDVHKFASTFVKWVEDKDDFDLVFTKERLFKDLIGDCNNHAEAARLLLVALGNKNNVDYRPMVVANNKHAVLVFLQPETGEWFCIEQKANLKIVGTLDTGIATLTDISSKFDSDKPLSRRLPLPGYEEAGLSYKVSLDPKTLEDNSSAFFVSYYAGKFADLKFKQIAELLLPEAKNYAQVAIFLDDAIIIIDPKTLQVEQVDFGEYDEEEELKRDYVHFYDSVGRVVQRHNMNEAVSEYEVEFFDPETGTLVEVIFWDGRQCKVEGEEIGDCKEE